MSGAARTISGPCFTSVFVAAAFRADGLPQHAAGYAENVNLYTAGHGLRSITRGSVPEAELLAALGLEPVRWFVALAQTVGK